MSEATAASGLKGRAVERVEDVRLLRGEGCYVDDIERPGMVYAVIVRSAQASGRLRHIDADAALAVPGVLAVFTHRDIAELAAPIPMRVGAMSELDPYRQLPLASDVVRYVGEPVAVVVAESRYVAEDAADMVFVDIDGTDPVVGMDAAESGASLVHEATGTNVAVAYEVARGEASAAFASAAYTRTETFRVQRHSSVPLETRGVVAEHDRASGRLTVWGAAKVPFFNRALLATMLRMPKEAVDLIEVDVGGSFGARGEFYPEDFLIPFAARALDRPVKWIEDRRENLLAMNHSRDVECTVSIAADRSGRILALQAAVRTDLGAYARTTGAIVGAKCASFLPGPYDIRNYSASVKLLVTNKTPSGTYRGPGRYEANFFRERIIDIMAHELGLDPAQVRALNLIRPEQMPYAIGRLVPYEKSESEYDTGDYSRALAHALERIGYDRLAAERGALRDGRYHGVGIACFVDSSGSGPAEYAKLDIVSPQEIRLGSGASSSGQGHETSFAQILADEMQVPLAAIRIELGSTTAVPVGVGTFHGRGLVMGGSAVKQAGRQFVEGMLSYAASRCDRGRETLRYAQGQVLAADGGALLSLDDVCRAAASGDTAAAAVLHVEAKFEQTRLTYEYGTQVAHVAVDPETWQVEVLQLLTVEDCGNVINPLIVHGQVLGASVQGLGGALLEEFWYDESGQMLSGTFADYLLPTATDFPRVEAVSVNFAPSKLNPLGAKGVGEGGTEGVGGAVANAVSNALRPLGFEVTSLPLSPTRLHAAVRASEGGPLDQNPKTGTLCQSDAGLHHHP